MQLLAVDNIETDEAAFEVLTDPHAVDALVTLASAAHQHAISTGTSPLTVELGTEVYAVHSGGIRFGSNKADVVYIGSPIWIGTSESRP